MLRSEAAVGGAIRLSTVTVHDLTAAQQHKFAQADAARRRLVAQLPWDLDTPDESAGYTTTVARVVQGPPRPRTTGKPKLGRNAPCWCGSGTKYKKCHLPLEERA